MCSQCTGLEFMSFPPGCRIPTVVASVPAAIHIGASHERTEAMRPNWVRRERLPRSKAVVEDILLL
jgi:hypothetical protein